MRSPLLEWRLVGGFFYVVAQDEAGELLFSVSKRSPAPNEKSLDCVSAYEGPQAGRRGGMGNSVPCHSIRLQLGRFKVCWICLSYRLHLEDAYRRVCTYPSSCCHALQGKAMHGWSDILRLLQDMLRI
jgi:hypothetical protein